MSSPKKDRNRLRVERHFPLPEKNHQLPVTTQFGGDVDLSFPSVPRESNPESEIASLRSQ